MRPSSWLTGKGTHNRDRTESKTLPLLEVTTKLERINGEYFIEILVKSCTD